MKLTRRSFLASAGAAATLGPAVAPRIARAAGSGVDHLVVVLADGGWDVTFCHDPKFHVDFVDGPEVDQGANPDDVDEIETFGEMPIVVNPVKRPGVKAFFDRWWDRTAVVNGLWIGSIAHQSCRLRLLTGTNVPTKPDMTSIVGHARGADKALGSIDFSGLGFMGELAASAGRVGRRSQIKALLDPASRFQPPADAGYTLPLFEPQGGELDAVRTYIERRAASYRDLHGMGLHNARAVDGMLESLERRQRLLDEAGPMVDGLEIGASPSLDLQSQLSATLFGNGLVQAVTLQHYQSWDTHDDNTVQHDRFDDFYTSLDGLVAELDSSGLLDRTLVAVVSEMTRTPRRNAAGGKDHWGHTSCMLIGAGVEAGRTYGGTNDNIESLPMDLETGEVSESAGELCKYDNLMAGILEHMGVDPAEWLPAAAPFRGAFTKA